MHFSFHATAFQPIAAFATLQDVVAGTALCRRLNNGPVELLAVMRDAVFIQLGDTGDGPASARSLSDLAMAKPGIW